MERESILFAAQFLHHLKANQDMLDSHVLSQGAKTLAIVLSSRAVFNHI